MRVFIFYNCPIYYVVLGLLFFKAIGMFLGKRMIGLGLVRCIMLSRKVVKTSICSSGWL